MRQTGEGKIHGLRQKQVEGRKSQEIGLSPELKGTLLDKENLEILVGNLKHFAELEKENNL